MKLAEFSGWFLFWLMVIVAVWVPNFLTKLANILGIGRGTDLVLYVSVVVVFYFIFRIYVRIERMESNITKIVRDDALSPNECHPEDSRQQSKDEGSRN